MRRTALVFITLCIGFVGGLRSGAYAQGQTIDKASLAVYNDLMQAKRYWDARVLASKYMPDTSEARLLVIEAEQKAIEVYENLIAERRFLDASNYVAKNMPKATFANKLIAEAEVKHFSSVIDNPKSSKDDRRRALVSISQLYPEHARRYSDKLKSIDAETLRAQKESSRKSCVESSKRGVSIGMLSSEVLCSSWGRPQAVNNTITKDGTHEQWVYGRGGYLYFENGILTAIQN